METETRSIPKRDLYHRLGSLTGLGWTTSTLGFASAVVGYGNGLVTRLVAEPHSLLYVGGVLFVATLGLDRLAASDDSE